MTNSRTLKRALLTSIIALVVCFSMLVGTTFAWFTDSVTSSGNIIQSGTLEVAMSWADGKEDPNSVAWKDAKDGAIFNNDKWEPGYVEARHLKIENKGTLAFKYKLLITPNGAVEELADVIDVYFVEGATQVNRNSFAGVAPVGTLRDLINDVDGAAHGALLPVGQAVTNQYERVGVVTSTIAFKMREEAGNEYQGKKIGADFAIQLLATQYTFENDSIDNGYDKLSSFAGEGSAPALTANQSAAQIEIRNTDEAKVGSVTIPKDATDPNASQYDASITASNYKGNFTVATGMETEVFDIKVEGLKENNDTPVKVMVRLDAGKDPATVKLYHYDTEIACSYSPTTGYVTFESTSFSPFTVVYDKDSVYVPPVVDENDGYPVAIVTEKPEHVNVDLPWGSIGGFSPTEGLDSHLEAAYEFKCKDTPEEASQSPYAQWGCDFFVKLDRDLGENQIFLGGEYGDFGWIGFHNGDLTLEANTEIGLLTSVTTNPWTYESIASFVGTFTCGVGDVDDALKGATFTVTLRIWNLDDESQSKDIAVIEYKFA